MRYDPWGSASEKECLAQPRWKRVERCTASRSRVTSTSPWCLNCFLISTSSSNQHDPPSPTPWCSTNLRGSYQNRVKWTEPSEIRDLVQLRKQNFVTQLKWRQTNTTTPHPSIHQHSRQSGSQARLNLLESYPLGFYQVHLFVMIGLEKQIKRDLS